MIYILPTLPYATDALKPFLSEETLLFHHGKHHAGYINKLNSLIEETEYADMSLEDIIRHSDGKIFNNAAQTFNHSFYWECLSPVPTKPSRLFEEKIINTFGSVENFKKAFIDSALSLFGSGWTWLVLDQNNKLKIVNTANAETPITKDEIPLITCDVWEHAYYIDYHNDRTLYLEEFWKHLNWPHASKLYSDEIVNNAS